MCCLLYPTRSMIVEQERCHSVRPLFATFANPMEVGIPRSKLLPFAGVLLLPISHTFLRHIADRPWPIHGTPSMRPCLLGCRCGPSTVFETNEKKRCQTCSSPQSFRSDLVHLRSCKSHHHHVQQWLAPMHAWLVVHRRSLGHKFAGALVHPQQPGAPSCRAPQACRRPPRAQDSCWRPSQASFARQRTPRAPSAPSSTWLPASVWTACLPTVSRSGGERRARLNRQFGGGKPR
mmetsp:Transcript_4055/g.25461  ORF Transcript_4055/g.25461 Transcript_4055/m.25461 type:complete len:234 (+) Transcript_4055:1404-2105(+)